MTRHLRIATFNLENLDDRARAEAGFADRLAVLRPQMIRLRADILCLQEVNAREDSRHGPRQLSALDALLDGTGYEGYHRLVSLNRGGQRYADHHNLVILSRLPILSARQLWHDLVKPPRLPVAAEGDAVQTVEWDRPLLQAEIDLGGGQRLHLFNLHLRAPRAAHLAGHKDHGVWSSVGAWAEGFFHASIKAAGQALEARLAIDAVFDAEPEAMIAVCGDLNALDREVPVRTLRGDEEDTGNGHLAPRSLVPVERSLPESLRHSVIHHGRPLMLDHILASRRLLGWYLGSELHNETLGDELVAPCQIEGPPDSYHAPLVAEFVRPGKGSS
ncbi:MAG TPA: endonuclease/exonuclease/phosphatase family protein [Candidatus Sulfotelmatobacter sp.]|jgi:endonuclease/exonuclease/phosphatase family metal-dependent hydrolase|nr:endonuclease/exonuclease/phosphatase family protein [Candidatus Sulfotelmatobacter sp.]